MPSLPIRFVVFRYRHHSPHSGYSRLAEFGAARYSSDLVRVDKPLSKKIVRERMLWRLARGTPGYDRAAMAAELRVALATVRQEPALYHFLYGETTYHYAGYLNGFRGNRVVASFHLPEPGFRQAIQVDWHLRQLAAVVCLGRNQEAFFSGVLPRDRVFFVPLGVDVDFYSPPSSSDDRDPDLCVFVGENYRDFPTLRGVVELVAYRRPATRFVGVLPRRSHGLIGRHPRLTLLADLDESDLLGLYKSAAAVFMPLTEAVANNALLEAMACGVPVVTSDVGAVRDYATSRSAVLVPPFDSRVMADAIVQLLDDAGRRRELSACAREQSLRFAWPVVTGLLDDVYSRASS